MRTENNAESTNNRSYIDCCIVCLAITVFFLALGVFVFLGAVGRIIESGRDFGLSLAYYFCRITGIPDVVTPTVNDYAKIPYFDFLSGTQISVDLFFEDWQDFTESWVLYWQTWISGDNFISYLSFVSSLFSDFSRSLMFILPAVILAYFLLKRLLSRQNNDYDKDSKALIIFKRISSVTYRPAKLWILRFISFLKQNDVYCKAWLAMWLFYFNVFTIFLEFMAYYLYFVVSFDFTTIYVQVCKLLIDLYVPVRLFPLWVWIVVALFLFDRFRKKIAYMRLNHYERRNRGFINARPIVYMVCGTMGRKKTTAITDMALSQEVMFRDKAFEKILENDLKFPFFPWINLENELKRAMEFHEVYNLATVRVFMAKKCYRWYKSPCRKRIFNYDYERCGLSYDDKLKPVDIWQVLENYAQLYFIYIIQSSLLISNYSVRTDNILSDVGNFPMWDSDFFKRDSRLMDSYSRHAHILDFDSVRLGKKVIDNNANADSFEFGVVLITEVGKERGNNLENVEKKKQSLSANQKNDLFNSWLKMIRHSATVDNFPFVRVITDEQRPESWGADARDLCEIVHIKDDSDTRLAMPFFSLGELLYSWIFSKFTNLYYRYRYLRSDNTLPMYLLKMLTAKIHQYYLSIYNRFGYCVLSVQLESGTQDGQLSENKYFLSNKKIYSRRFSTDCFSDFFTEKALRSSVGINDLAEYVTECATFGELSKQNSYFINDLLAGLKDDK